MNDNSNCTLEPMLSPQKVADVLGLTRQEIHSMINEGEFGDDVVKLSRKIIRIPESAVRNLLKNSRIRIPDQVSARRA